VGCIFDVWAGNIVDKSPTRKEIDPLAKAKATQEELAKLTKYLGIQQASITAQLGENWYPDRGIGPVPPTDPVIYRLYEAVLVYGHPIKVCLEVFIVVVDLKYLLGGYPREVWGWYHVHD